MEKLLALKVYDWPAEKFETLKPLLCASDIDALIVASNQCSQG